MVEKDDKQLKVTVRTVEGVPKKTRLELFSFSFPYAT